MKRCRMLKGDSKTQIAHIWIFMNELFSCVLFFPRSAATISHLRLPFFSLCRCEKLEYLHQKLRAKSERASTMKCRAQRYARNRIFSPFACMWVCICSSFFSSFSLYVLMRSHILNCSIQLITSIAVTRYSFASHICTLFWIYCFPNGVGFLFSCNVFFFGAKSVKLRKRCEYVVTRSSRHSHLPHKIV